MEKNEKEKNGKEQRKIWGKKRGSERKRKRKIKKTPRTRMKTILRKRSIKKFSEREINFEKTAEFKESRT